MYVLRLDFKPITDLALTREWSMDIFVEISDNFGLDRDDVLTYQNKNVGFAAWWVLQRQRGYKPFKVKMLITQKIKGKL
jgi:Protein of unknown function (DUF3289)